MADLEQFQQRLGYTFRDPKLLRLALTHSSLAHETGNAPDHNQRLEFLGDAVLQLSLTRELYVRFPGLSEGPLTKARARMVNQASLAEQSRLLDIGAHLAMSRAEETNGGRERRSIIADAFEALLGAVFLDGGYEAARTIVVRLFEDRLANGEELAVADNPKGDLQELLQGQSQQSPEYALISATGPDHDREFECSVLHLGRELARGKGRSKKIAESNAALAALTILRPGGSSSGTGEGVL